MRITMSVEHQTTLVSVLVAIMDGPSLHSLITKALHIIVTNTSTIIHYNTQVTVRIKVSFKM